MAHPTRRFNRWIFEGMFLGWGALMGFVLLVLFAVVATLTPEPVALVLVAVAITFLLFLSLSAAFDRRSRTRGPEKPHQSP